MHRMIAAFASLSVLAACGQGADAPRAPDEAAPVASTALTQDALVGVWSFDRSCGSGDGMSLNADGTAAYDEWGDGTWRLADANRVVLTLDVHEMGVGPTGAREVIAIQITPPVTDNLNGEIGGDPPRAINARRC